MGEVPPVGTKGGFLRIRYRTPPQTRQYFLVVAWCEGLGFTLRIQNTIGTECEGRVRDGPASGEKGSKGEFYTGDPSRYEGGCHGYGNGKSLESSFWNTLDFR